MDPQSKQSAATASIGWISSATRIATDDAKHDAFGGFVMVKSESLEPDGPLSAFKVGEFPSSQARGRRISK